MELLMVEDQPSILPVLQIMIPNVSIANFAENASATGRSLGRVLDQLKDIVTNEATTTSRDEIGEIIG